MTDTLTITVNQKCRTSLVKLDNLTYIMQAAFVWLDFCDLISKYLKNEIHNNYFSVF